MLNTKKKEKRILIIEDDQEIQKLLKAALEDEGFIVHTANNGKDGFEQLSKIPTPNLILLDIVMPVMSGWNFIDEIEKNIAYSNIPIVVLTATLQSVDQPKTDEYILKPLDIEHLINIANKHCKQ